MLNLRQHTVAEIIADFPRLMKMGRNAEVETIARDLQRQFPARGEVNEALALVLINLGKPGDALPFAIAAVTAEPKNAGYLINLGRLYLSFELIEEALPLLEKAFRIQPSLYQAPWALGEFFHKIGIGQRAIRYLKQAIKVAPAADKIDIHRLLADSLSSMGKIDEAETAYRELEEDKRYRCYATVQIANLRKHDIDSPMLKSLLQELREPELQPQDSMGLHLAVGRIYENAREYGKAYKHFCLSKCALEHKFDLGRFRETVDNLIYGYQDDVMRRFEGYGDTSGLPVFVVGMPRSGTTLTEQIIAAHSKGGGAGELRRISRMREALSGEEMKPHNLFKRMLEGGPERCRDLARMYVSMLKFLVPGARRVVDKMPHNFLAIGFIAHFFPNARIVHCVRNPADNFISAFQNAMNAHHSYAYAQEDYAAYYREYARLMRHWQSLMPGKIFNLRYEELVENPEPKIRNLLEFLELPWDSNCLRFHERDAMVKTFSRHQVRAAVHKGSVERWRNYEKQLQPLLAMLKDEMEMAQP